MTRETELRDWVGEWAERTEVLSLSPIVTTLLEVARPFGFLGAQVLLIVQPLLEGFVSTAALERTATALNDPQALDQLDSE